MFFSETRLQGSYILRPEPIWDERGFFARVFCGRGFEEHGLVSNFVQHSVSYNVKKGTLRGMHFQAPPHQETKLVRCTRGVIYDVILDLRPDSSTFKQWVAVELSAENRLMLYIPEGFAHGFQTLEDDTEVFYQISEYYYAEFAKGVLWNDSAFDIQWAIEPTVISVRDQQHPDFCP